MTRTARTMKWTALAIATAILAAPSAYSGGKLPVANKVKVSTLSPQAAKAAKKQPQQHDRFIVTYRSDAKRLSAAATTQQLASASKTLGVGIAPMRTLATGSSLIRTDRKLDSAATKQLMIELMKDPNVLAVEPDRLRKPLMVPNDPLYAQQWHYKNGPGGINAEPAWELSTGDGVVVAVLDTGSTPHSELNGQYVAGYDFIIDTEVSVDGDGRDADPNDPGDWHDGECNIFGIPEDSSWHGTHVAGTVAAATNNNAGVAGVAFGAKVQPVRVLGKCGGYESDIIDAVTWASGGTVAGVPANATPAEVINLSLGGSGACSVAEQAAYTAAKGRGTTVVVSAGNSSADAANYSPASCSDVITVSSVGPTGALSGFSNFGNVVDVAAPGGSGVAPAADNILSTLNLGLQGQEGEGYAWYAGTSMSAPHVSGVIALMQSAAATPKTPDEVKKILENTAYASGGFPSGCSYNKYCGAGIVDARYAVAVAAGTEPLPPDVPPPPPPPPAIELDQRRHRHRHRSARRRHRALPAAGPERRIEPAVRHVRRHGRCGPLRASRRGPDPDLVRLPSFQRWQQRELLLPGTAGGHLVRDGPRLQQCRRGVAVSQLRRRQLAALGRGRGDPARQPPHPGHAGLDARQEEHRHLPQRRHPQDREEQRHRDRYVPRHRQRHHELQAVQQRYAGMCRSGRDRLRVASLSCATEEPGSPGSSPSPNPRSPMECP